MVPVVTPILPTIVALILIRVGNEGVDNATVAAAACVVPSISSVIPYVEVCVRYAVSGIIKAPTVNVVWVKRYGTSVTRVGDVRKLTALGDSIAGATRG